MRETIPNPVSVAKAQAWALVARLRVGGPEEIRGGRVNEAEEGFQPGG